MGFFKMFYFFIFLFNHFIYHGITIWQYSCHFSLRPSQHLDGLIIHIVIRLGKQRSEVIAYHSSHFHTFNFALISSLYLYIGNVLKSAPFLRICHVICWSHKDSLKAPFHGPTK